MGDSLVIDVNDDVVLVEDGEQRATRLARDHRAISTSDDDSVWVASGDPSGMSTASLLTLDGRVVHQVSLPAVTQPVAGAGDSLIVATPAAVIRITVDGSRRVVAPGEAVASNGHRLAWLVCGVDLSCQVAIGTVDDPDQARVPLDPADLPSLFGALRGVFSPDGRWLVLPLYRVSDTGATATSSVSIIDSVTGVEVERSPESGQFNVPIAWSPDSRWLAFERQREIHLWGAERREFVALDVELVPAVALALR